MDLKIRRFMRKPFLIDAVQVTDDNMPDVAQWCGGEVRTQEPYPGTEGQRYIKVRVRRALNDRQTQAFVGDWVLFAGTSYKVYTPKAFANSFEEINVANSFIPDLGASDDAMVIERVSDDQLTLALSHLDAPDNALQEDVKFQIKTPPATKKEKSA